MKMASKNGEWRMANGEKPYVQKFKGGRWLKALKASWTRCFKNLLNSARRILFGNRMGSAPSVGGMAKGEWRTAKVFAIPNPQSAMPPPASSGVGPVGESSAWDVSKSTATANENGEWGIANIELRIAKGFPPFAIPRSVCGRCGRVSTFSMWLKSGCRRGTCSAPKNPFVNRKSKIGNRWRG